MTFTKSFRHTLIFTVWAGAVLHFVPRIGAQVKVTPVLGAQKLAVVHMDILQDGKAQTQTMLHEGLIRNPKSVNAFLLEASYGKAWLEPEYFAPKVYTEPLMADGLSGCFPEAGQIVEFFEDEVDFSKFDRVLAVLHDSVKVRCPGGLSTVGQYPFVNSKGTHMVSVGMVRSGFWFFQDPVTQELEALPDVSQMTGGIYAHELLHGLGMSGHANSYRCGEDIVRMDTVGCAIFSYGSPFDIQGAALLASHPQALIKEKLGWLPAENIREIVQDGEYEIAPLEKPSVKTQVLKVRLTKKIPVKRTSAGIDSLEYLSIQYQGTTGFDYREAAYLEIRQADGVTMRTVTNRHGAQIHGISCAGSGECRTYLLDMTPNSLNPYYPFQEFADGFLDVDRTFTVPENGIRITTTQVTPDQSIKVRVELGSTAVAGLTLKPALRSIQLVSRDVAIGRVRVPVGAAQVVLASLDGRMWDFPIRREGIADLSRLSRGVYLATGAASGKVIIP